MPWKGANQEVFPSLDHKQSIASLSSVEIYHGTGVDSIFGESVSLSPHPFSILTSLETITVLKSFSEYFRIRNLTTTFVSITNVSSR